MKNPQKYTQLPCISMYSSELERQTYGEARKRRQTNKQGVILVSDMCSITYKVRPINEIGIPGIPLPLATHLKGGLGQHT